MVLIVVLVLVLPLTLLEQVVASRSSFPVGQPSTPALSTLFLLLLLLFFSTVVVVVVVLTVILVLVLALAVVLPLHTLRRWWPRALPPKSADAALLPQRCKHSCHCQLWTLERLQPEICQLPCRLVRGGAPGL